MRASHARLPRPSAARPIPVKPSAVAGFLWIIWVLTLTASAITGTILWSARVQCDPPCQIDSTHVPQSLKSGPTRPVR
jgi:hypothetical protein